MQKDNIEIFKITIENCTKGASYHWYINGIDDMLASPYFTQTIKTHTKDFKPTETTLAKDIIEGLQQKDL